MQLNNVCLLFPCLVPISSWMCPSLYHRLAQIFSLYTQAKITLMTEITQITQTLKYCGKSLEHLSTVLWTRTSSCDAVLHWCKFPNRKTWEVLAQKAHDVRFYFSVRCMKEKKLFHSFMVRKSSLDWLMVICLRNLRRETVVLNYNIVQLYQSCLQK